MTKTAKVALCVFVPKIQKNVQVGFGQIWEPRHLRVHHSSLDARILR